MTWLCRYLIAGYRGTDECVLIEIFMKYFSVSLTAEQNKLECLSLQSFVGWFYLCKLDQGNSKTFFVTYK
jgi:hypothetical protein